MEGKFTLQQEWWTAQEIADARLPGLPGTAQGVNAVAEREGWRRVEGGTRRKAGRGGGLQYHWTVLPFDARTKLLKKEAAQRQERADRGQAWATYDPLSQKDKDEAARRVDVLVKVQALHDSGATHTQAVDAAASAAGVSPRTVYNWLAMVEGTAREDWLAYVAPRKPKKRLTAEDKAETKPFMDWLKTLYLRLEGPTFAQCHRLTVKQAEAEGWPTLILKTAKRRLDEEVPRVAQVFRREGLGGLMRCYPSQIRDRSSLTAMEAVNADCHKIDVFVEWPDGTINRPQIVAFQDIFSGKILSWRVDHDPNKVMVMAAFSELAENWGIPKHCLFDNGREFANKWMTAGAPTRFRFKIREDDPVGVLPLMGIEMHWATPAHGQAKPIERAFRDLASDIAKDPRFAGAYVGNRPDAKPENYGQRAIPADEFLAVLDEGITEHNARPGRQSHTAKGRSFDETFAESYATAPIAKLADAQRRLLLMGHQTGTLRRDNGQLRLFGNYYHCDWMSQEAGRKVVARFNPEDLHSGVEIFAPDGAYLGFAECQQKVGFFDLAGARKSARRRSQIAKAEKALRDLHTPVPMDEITTAMNGRSTAEPAALEAKVVKPVFRPVAAQKPFAQTPNADAARARDAMVLNLQAKRKEQAPAPAAETFQVAATPEARFKQAGEIEKKIKKEQPVGERERTWLESFKNHPEYIGRMAMNQALNRRN